MKNKYDIIDKALQEELEERSKYFDVEVRRDFTHLPFVILSLTQDGRFWNGLRFYSQEQIDKTIKVLQECDIFKKVSQ